MGKFVPSEPGGGWPSGHYADAAVIPLSEADLSQLLGMTPLRGTQTGLGPWVAFGGALENVVMELISYKHSPGPAGFTLRVDAGANAGALLKSFITLAGLGQNELPWVAPKLAQQVGEDGLPGSSSR